MTQRFIVTLRQGTFKPDGTQALAVFGTIKKLTEDIDSILIGERLKIYRSDVYSITVHEGPFNKELIWVL